MAAVSRPSVYTAMKSLSATIEKVTDGQNMVRLRLRPGEGCAVGLDLGERHARVALADLNGRMFRAEHSTFERPFAPDTAPEEFLDWSATAIEDVLAEAGVGPEEVLGIGVSRAAPIDRRTHLPHLSGLTNRAWQDVDVAHILRHRLGWPNVPVVTDNDANLSALAELTVGALTAVDDAIYIKWSDGIGAAIILNGEVYRGHRGYAGELGHFRVHAAADAKDPPCPRCGKTGCLASTVGAASIARRVGIAQHAEERKHGPPGTEKYGLRGAAERLLELLDQHDDDVRGALTRAAEQLAEAVVPTVDMLDPEVLLIGGGLGAHMHDHTELLSTFRHSLNAAMMGFAQNVRIARPQEHGFSAVHGATLLVLSEHLLHWARARHASVRRPGRRHPSDRRPAPRREMSPIAT